MSRIKKPGATRWAVSALAALALMIAPAIVITTPSAANATEDPSVCVPSEAWDEQVLVTPEVPATPDVPAVTHNEYQRYSWVGGGQYEDNGPGNSTPATNPGDWQANTTNYEGAGHGTDPIGVAFQQGNGNGSWFFWTKTEVVDTPAVPGTPGSPAVYETVHHPAVECPTVPEKPETPQPTTETVYGPWSTEQPTCENPTVTQSRSVSTVTTTYEVVWNDETKAWDTISHKGEPVTGDPELRLVRYEGDDCGGNIVVPNPVISIGGGCYANPGDAPSPFTLGITWDKVEGQTFAIVYKFYKVNPDGSLGEMIYRVFGDNLTDGDVKANEVVVDLQSQYDFSKTPIAVTAQLTHNGTGAQSEIVRGDFVVTQCDIEPPVTFTPPQPTFEALQCVDGAPQTSVVIPEVDPAKGYYTVDGEKASGTVVVPGVVRIGFQFADGVTPPKDWPGLNGFTPETCAVVVPPVVTPPVQPTMPTDDGGHKTPSKVETDGDMSPIVWLAGLAGLLALVCIGGVTTLRPARRRS